MRYNIFSILDALECFYVTGFSQINLQDFLYHFCKKYDLQIEDEKDRILHILETLKKKNKINMENDEIYLHNPLTKGLRLVINDMES